MLITQDVIDRVPCTQLFGFTNDENRYIQECHKELLSLSMRRNKSDEVGFLIDITNWERLVVWGDSHGIIMDSFPEARSLLDTAWNNHLIFLHNHPNNSCFSGNDLKSFCKHKSLYMITAIQNNGNIHVLAKTSAFYPEALLFEYNKYVEQQKGVVNVLRQASKLGLQYKYGRCKK